MTRPGRTVLRLAMAVGVFLLLEADPASAATRSSALSPTLIELSGGETADEWIALAHAVRSKQLEVVALVVPTTDPDAANVRVARNFRELLNRPDIEIIPSIRPEVDSSAFEGWLQSPSEPIPAEANEDLGEAVLSVIELDSGDLQVISLGRLDGLTAAWRKDPSAVSKLRRILLSGGSIDGVVYSGIPGFEAEAAELLLSATPPVVIFPHDPDRTLRFTIEHQKDLAAARTDLSDALSRLTAFEIRSSRSNWDEGIHLAHSAAVSYGFDKDVVELEKREMAFGSSAASRTTIWTPTSYRYDAILDALLFQLKDPMTDFSYGFSHYLLGLPRFSGSTKLAIAERLKNIPSPTPPAESGSIRSDRLWQMLEYLESTLECFHGITGDPAAADARDILLETYLKVGSIGWLFPDDFYAEWAVSVDEEGKFELECGVSNPQGRTLERVELEVWQADRKIAAASVESASGDVRFPMQGAVEEGDRRERAEPLSFRVRLDAAGFPHSGTHTIPIQRRH